MYLNTLQPAPGTKQNAKRVGRGIGSGLGKTCGRGHKGQHARAGGLRKVGFEGGQMPLQRRLPKAGFFSHASAKRVEIRLGELDKLDAGVVDIMSLQRAGLVSHKVEKVKIIVSGKVSKAFTLRGIVATKGARAALEAAGGSIE